MNEKKNNTSKLRLIKTFYQNFSFLYFFINIAFFISFLLEHYKSDQHYSIFNKAKIQSAVKFCERINILYYKKTCFVHSMCLEKQVIEFYVTSLQNINTNSLIIQRHKVEN